ncbi:hypothetical protein NBRC116597_20820 [Phaeobacter sp. NW0010-22]
MSTGAQIKADSVITGECGNVMDTWLKKFETANKKASNARPPPTPGPLQQLEYGAGTFNERINSRDRVATPPRHQIRRFDPPTTRTLQSKLYHTCPSPACG